MTVHAELRVPPSSYALGSALSDQPDASIELERAVPTAGEIHYAWVAGEGHEAILDDLGTVAPVEGLEPVETFPGRTLVRFEWAGETPPLFSVVDEADATLVGLTGTQEGWTLRSRFPDRAALSAFTDACLVREIPVELRAFHGPDDPDDPDGDDGYGVTPTQSDTLMLAFEEGYFDVPRGTTLAELADRIGVSEQAVSERIRRGLSSFLTTVLLDEEADGTPRRDGPG